MGKTFSVKSMFKNSIDLYSQADKVTINSKALLCLIQKEGDHHAGK